MRNSLAIMAAFTAAFVACQSVNAAIVISGFTLEQYAGVTDPRAIAFDSSGNL